MLAAEHILIPERWETQVTPSQDMVLWNYYFNQRKKLVVKEWSSYRDEAVMATAMVMFTFHSR